MYIAELNQIDLVGLSLKEKTSNLNGQSSIDCKLLWDEFHHEKYADLITDKLSEEIYGVYYDYEEDSNKPFSYFIGCKVPAGAKPPDGLRTLTIPGGFYQQITVTGVMPECMIEAWKNILITEYPRRYEMDFEVYDERCLDWNNAEVDIYLSVRR